MRVKAGSGSSDRRWRRWLAYVGGCVLALVLIIAAWGKALDPGAFAEQIAHEGLDVILGADGVAWIVVVVEAALGAALLLGLRTRLVLATAGGLIAVFMFLSGRSYLRWLLGIEIEGPDCGCFGNLLSRTPAEAFWQDLLLLLPPYALCWFDVAKRRRWASARWAVVAAVAAAAGVFILRAPLLPLDDLATRLAPGVTVGELCAGSSRRGAQKVCLDLLIPELEQGRHLVVIERLDSPAVGGSVDLLNALVGSGKGSVWMVADADETRRQVFFWEWGPLFDVREAPSALLRPLYRTLPRSFQVDSGVVVRTWAGLPEFGAEADAL